MSASKYWVTVVSKEHVLRGIAGGFMQANHGKAAPLKRMQVGDGVVYYSPKVTFEGSEKLQAFTAIGRITGDTIYQHDMGGGFVPYRRDVTYLDCVEIPIQPLIPALTFIQDKTSWGYLFRFGFFEIPQIDFDLIASQMLLQKEV